MGCAKKDNGANFAPEKIQSDAHDKGSLNTLLQHDSHSNSRTNRCEDGHQGTRGAGR